MNKSILSGFAHVYSRAHINTDEIIPARYLNTHDEKELGKHAMEDIDKDFIKKVKQGDIIIASDDFGCGSSREHAIWALRAAGVKCIIANSFARIFYRNAINNGMLALESNGIADKIKTGDALSIDLKKGEIKNITQKTACSFLPVPDFAIEIMDAGGLLQHIKTQKKEN